MNWFEDIGLKIGDFLAGCAGAFVSLVSLLQPKKLKWNERLLIFVAGGLSAMYIAPFVTGLVESIRPLGSSAEFFMAYLVGYSGLKSTELAISELKKRFGIKP